MEFLRLNGKAIKAPKEITISPENLDKAERTMDGTMVVDIIGTKRKIDVSWEYLSKEDMTILANATRKETFTQVTFHEKTTAEFITITARAEGLTYSPFYDWAKDKLLWKGVAVTFKEK